MSKEIPCQKCGHVWLWAGWKKQKDAFCPEGHGCNSKTKDSIEQLAATNKQLEAKLATCRKYRDAWHRWLGGDLSLGLAKSRILGLITPDAQAALDRVVAAERDRIEELEAKLAKAMEALGRAKASIENGGGGGVTDVVWLDDPCPETLCDFIDATLAELSSVSCANLKGQDDE